MRLRVDDGGCQPCRLAAARCRHCLLCVGIRIQAMCAGSVSGDCWSASCEKSAGYPRLPRKCNRTD